MKKILIVEDEKNIRLLYDEELSAEGYIVTTVQDGLRALKILTLQDFDLLILDVKMPIMDGRMICKKIKNENINIPIIINTAYDNYRMDFEELKADAYVIKSSDISHLKNKVYELIGN